MFILTDDERAIIDTAGNFAGEYLSPNKALQMHGGYCYLSGDGLA